MTIQHCRRLYRLLPVTCAVFGLAIFVTCSFLFSCSLKSRIIYATTSSVDSSAEGYIKRQHVISLTFSSQRRRHHQPDIHKTDVTSHTGTGNEVAEPPLPINVQQFTPDHGNKVMLNSTGFQRYGSVYDIQTKFRFRRVFVKSINDGSQLRKRKHGGGVVSDDIFMRFPKASYGYQPISGIVRSSNAAIPRLPLVLIIGVKKGGTRALLEFIRMHPDVRASGPETHFFDRKYDFGLDWYRKQMPPTIDGQLTIEKTPSYFITKHVPHRAHNMSSSLKLIVVLRDPVTRAISDYTQIKTKRPGTKPFDQLAFLSNIPGLVDSSWMAIRIGIYFKHLERWLRFFPLSQFHFVSGERLISDPAGEMGKLQDFLGLKRIINEKHFYFNDTKGFPCLKKTENRGHPHCLGKTKGRHHSFIEPRVIQILRDFFRPFNNKLYQIVGQNFGWT